MAWAKAGPGRPKGRLNKTTADVKALAGKHGPAAIAQLVKLMKKSDSDAAKVAAAKEILDRAYGKSAQPHVGDDSATPINVLHRIERLIVGPADQDR
jgi:hypothetical protein